MFLYLLISVIAIVVAVPIGLMSAIYLSEDANKNFRSAAKPLIEILAGIPTVVYGLLGLAVFLNAKRHNGCFCD